jgi:tripartite-type tricarboxylate transporter receptor subunit TctC
MNIVRNLLVAAAAAASLICASQASAGTYPDRAIRIVVPFPAGGAQDVLARAVGERLSKRLKQPVIIENKAGAAGNLGADYLAKSSPDGYTFGILSGVHTANAAFYRKLNYNLATDFTPVHALGESAVLLVVNPKAPFKDVPTLIEYAKKYPNKVNFASTSSLVRDLLKTMTGAEIQMITYKGVGEAITDLVGGRLDIVAGPAAQMLPLIEQGRIEALAVASNKRIPSLPNTRTVGETVRGFNAGMWYGLFAPLKTPPEIVQRVSQELDAIVKQPDFAKQLSVLGIEPATPAFTNAEMQRRITSETSMWKAVVAKTGNYAN